MSSTDKIVDHLSQMLVVIEQEVEAPPRVKRKS